mmetsp:Transcript_18867/g.37935  ORF Transcript_18867/g.37935 Transcript_18867/m.37935 type:complete len:142 (+) Transcript_18867:1-426(+)
MDFWLVLNYCAPLSRGGCFMNDPFSFILPYISYGESSGGDNFSGRSKPLNTSISTKSSKTPVMLSFEHTSFSKSSKSKKSGKSSKSIFGKSSKALSSESIPTTLSAKSSNYAAPTGLREHTNKDKHRLFRGKQVREEKLFG